MRTKRGENYTMKISSILSAIESIVNGNKYTTASFVKFTDKYDTPDNNIIYVFLRHEEGQQYFDFYCYYSDYGDANTAMEFPLPSEEDYKDWEGAYTGYGKLPGNEKIPIDKWESTIRRLEKMGFVNRDKYRSQAEDFILSEDEVNSLFNKKQEYISKMNSKMDEMTDDASDLIRRLYLISTFVENAPEDVSLETLEEAVNQHNQSLVDHKFRDLTEPSIIFYEFTLKTLEDIKILMEEIMQLVSTNKIKKNIGQLVKLLQKLFTIAPLNCEYKRIMHAIYFNSKGFKEILESELELTGYSVHSYRDFDHFGIKNSPDIKKIDELDSDQFEANNNNIRIENADDALKGEVINIMGKNSPKLINVYRIKNAKTETRYNDDMAKHPGNSSVEKLLWHGSPTVNWIGIINEGLLLSKANDGMFGKGIYFADDLDKSGGYTSANGSRHAGGRDLTGFVALFKVRTGEMLELHSACESAKSRMKMEMCDSVKGCKGKSLRKNEYVIYNEAQCTIYALVEIKLS